MATVPGTLSPKLQEPGKILLMDEALTFPSLEMTAEQNQRAKHPAYPRTATIYKECIPELLPWLQASGLLWINCSTVPDWTTAFTLDVMDIVHARKKNDGSKFLLLNHFCTELEKQSHWIMAGVSKEVMVMQSFINQAISQCKDTFGPKISQEARELAARKSMDKATDARKLREFLGKLFSLAVKGGCQVYVFVDNIDAMYPPSSGAAAGAERDRENDFDELVRMLKETAQCGREITRKKGQQQINVLVTSRHLCVEKYLASKEVSLSSKSLLASKIPRMNISKILFPAIVPVREVKMAIINNKEKTTGDEEGGVRKRLGRAGDVVTFPFPFPVKIIKRRKERDDGEEIFGMVPTEPRGFIDCYGYG